MIKKKQLKTRQVIVTNCCCSTALLVAINIHTTLPLIGAICSNLNADGVKVHKKVFDGSHVYVRKNVVRIRVPQLNLNTANPFSLTYKFAFDQDSSIKDVRDTTLRILSEHDITVTQDALKLYVENKMWPEKRKLVAINWKGCYIINAVVSSSGKFYWVIWP